MLIFLYICSCPAILVYHDYCIFYKKVIPKNYCIPQISDAMCYANVCVHVMQGIKVYYAFFLFLAVNVRCFFRGKIFYKTIWLGIRKWTRTMLSTMNSTTRKVKINANNSALFNETRTITNQMDKWTLTNVGWISSEAV